MRRGRLQIRRQTMPSGSGSGPNWSNQPRLERQICQKISTNMVFDNDNVVIPRIEPRVRSLFRLRRFEDEQPSRPLSQRRRMQPALRGPATSKHHSAYVRWCWYLRRVASRNIVHAIDPRSMMQVMCVFLPRGTDITKRPRSTHDIHGTIQDVPLGYTVN